MAENQTIFQRLNNVFRGTGRNKSISPDVMTTPMQSPDRSRVLYTTTDKREYEKKLKSLKQQKYLAYQWQKAGADNAMESLAGYTAVKLMYRDVDLMDGTPEIGTALDIISEEAVPMSSNGTLLEIKSRSNRVKSILEDLFVNRLHIYTELQMIARHLCKYGNTFMLLNIDKDNGVMGWMMMPVYEVDREENGYSASYTTTVTTGSDIKPDTVRFVWRGNNGDNPYRNWQVAHFRYLEDSFFLPYGTSMLHKARRTWRMWSIMEDMMLLWRQDKAIDRRVYKIYVGGIDDADVKAYVNDIANEFKRGQIIDPETGQIDLRQNFLTATQDFFIPVRNESAPTPIENLPSSNSQVQMEDIEYMQNKMLTALRVPKTFLNFQEAQGKGQNLSFLDIRFSRMIVRLQQFLLMELNKVAMIHLYLMGLEDEIGNFTLSLNSPSTQIKSQELDDMMKKLQAMQTALSDPGSGIPILSLHKALKDIMGMSDSEIKDMLNEIRLEKAMAFELQATPRIIKKTGVFDTTDRIYGDYEALNNPNIYNVPVNPEDAQGGGGGGMGGGFGGDFGGDDMDLGEPGSEGGGDLSGLEGETDMGGAPAADEGAPLQEGKKFINEMKEKKQLKSALDEYFDMLTKGEKERGEYVIKEEEEAYDYDAKNTSMKHTINTLFEKIDKLVDEEEMAREKLLKEAKENDSLVGDTGKTIDIDYGVVEKKKKKRKK